MERNHLGTHKKNFWSNSHSLSNNIHFVFNKVAQCVPTYSCLAASPIDKRFWQMHAKDIHVHVLWYSTTLWQSFSCCLYEKWKFKISSWCISESTQNMHVIVISPKKRIIQFTDTSMTAPTVNQIITENTGDITHLQLLLPVSPM